MKRRACVASAGVIQGRNDPGAAVGDDDLGLEIFRAIEGLRARIEVERELDRFVDALAAMRWAPPASDGSTAPAVAIAPPPVARRDAA